MNGMREPILSVPSSRLDSRVARCPIIAQAQATGCKHCSDGRLHGADGAAPSRAVLSHLYGTGPGGPRSVAASPMRTSHGWPPDITGLVEDLSVSRGVDQTTGML
jgi:hypothetical protein